MTVDTLMEHIANEIGVSPDAKTPFKYGYLSGLLEDILLRYPETRAALDVHAQKYKFEGN